MPETMQKDMQMSTIPLVFSLIYCDASEPTFMAIIRRKMAKSTAVPAKYAKAPRVYAFLLFFTFFAFAPFTVCFISADYLHYKRVAHDVFIRKMAYCYAIYFLKHAQRVF